MGLKLPFCSAELAAGLPGLPPALAAVGQLCFLHRRYQGKRAKADDIQHFLLGIGNFSR